MTLPGEPRVRFWKPAPALQSYVGNYHLYAVAPDQSGAPVEAVFFPGSATLRFKLTPDSSWQARFRDDKTWKDLTGATLFGPSNGVTWSRTTAGIAVGVGLTVRGMAQFLTVPASDIANRIVPALAALRLDCDRIGRDLAALRDDDGIAPLIDEALLGAFDTPHEAEPVIARIEAVLANPDVRTVAAVQAASQLSERTLQRFCRRHFGFKPHTLLRRTRFLRSLSAINNEQRGQRTAAIDDRYTDYSHFIRDAHFFLGTSPEEFLRRLTPVERRAMMERAAVIGQPMHGLAEPHPAPVAGN